MYAVIFRAKISRMDEQYLATAEKMRDLAIARYGCREFVSSTQGDQEIAISYWDDEDQIRAWKEDLEHQQAQQQGRSAWYESYTVQVAEIVRAYSR